MSHHHLYAIGNALVDTEYEVSDAQLEAMGISKRHMTLIDGSRRSELLGHVQGLHARRTGGGSAGNTVVALAQLGGKAFYSCCVADDELGAFYLQDLQANGVSTNLSHTRARHGQTGSCMVLVTPDAERTMCTFLGVSADLESSALQPQDIARSRIYYMAGDHPCAIGPGARPAGGHSRSARASGPVFHHRRSQTSIPDPPRRC